VASVANPAVTGTIVLSSFPASVAFLSYATRPVTAFVTFGSGSWQAIFLADTILDSSQPEGAERIAVTCRSPHGPPSDGVELAPFLITAYSALRLELLPSQAPGEL